MSKSIVPTIKGSGTGRSIYYSRSDLVELAIMEYLLAVGLSFREVSRGLKELIEADFHYAAPGNKQRWMLLWDEKKRSLILMEFEREKAIACSERGQSVIPLCRNSFMVR